MWSIVLTVAAFGRAPHPPELAHAFFLDTLCAVRATPGTGPIVVVTGDPLAAEQAGVLGAEVCAEGPDPTPAAAARRGCARAARLAPGTPVALLRADLPALRPADLTTALTRARAHPNAYATDASGTLTTLSTTRFPRVPGPGLGPGSPAHHRARGSYPLPVLPAGGLAHPGATGPETGMYTRALLHLRPSAREMAAASGAS
ncbi:hypothetical protein ACGFZL_11850 [Streptomyces sp. NPDC048182]|uniref:hypothetical protein n=1 Tax=Streptomyces sp. NPDC048182 TaxID=3365507 RepID=UPI0037167682